MKNFSLSNFSWHTKSLWWLMVCAAITALGFAAFQLFTFSPVQIVTMATAMFIAVIVSQHQIRVPKTRISFSAKELIILWGTIWLGVAGGVLLAACVSLARYKTAPKNKQHWYFSVALNIFSSFIAANVFYSSLSLLFDFKGHTVGDSAFNFGIITVVLCLTAITHLLSTVVFTSLFLRLEANYSIWDQWRDSSISTTFGYLFGLVATLLFHLAFLTFNLPFGLVILVVAVFGHMAFQIHVKSLDQKTKEIKEASRIHLATVEALATAIDARDQVGLGHVRRTQIFAIGIGEILNLSEDEIHALRTGALLHDIGKLAVPDHILNKPGRLTSAEMEKIKIHASVGAAILEKVGFTYPVVPTVKYHHEMWDGTGYPEGRIGEDIPLTARILSVADAYDTLRSARPFRPAISRDESRKLLLSGAGTKFDPKIVDVLLRNLRRLEQEIEVEGLTYDCEDQNEINYYGHEIDNKGYIQQIKLANREVFTLYELARVFSSSLNLEQTLALFVKKIGELIPFDSCVIYLLEEDNLNANAIYAEGKNASALKNKKIKAGEGATGYVLTKKQPVHEVDPELDFIFDNAELGHEYSAMVSLPLLAGDNLLGAVSLYTCELKSYQEEHMRLLETISRIAADALGKTLEHAETETRALTDPMTNLPNARSLYLHFEKEIARASRKGTVVQVLMLDLDGFKAVNDTYGHKVGDDMLKQLAGILREQLRDYDFLARYAGDEFVAIVPETTDDAISELCCRMEDAVSDFAMPVEGGKFAKVGISIGAASYPNQGETLDQVLIAADKAMYSIKAVHKQKNSHILTQQDLLPEEIVSVEKVLAEAVSVEKVLQDAFIVELDESHVLSSAVN